MSISSQSKGCKTYFVKEKAGGNAGLFLLVSAEETMAPKIEEELFELPYLEGVRQPFRLLTLRLYVPYIGTFRSFA